MRCNLSQQVQNRASFGENRAAKFKSVRKNTLLKHEKQVVKISAN